MSRKTSSQKDARSPEAPHRPRLYLIAPDRFVPADFSRLLEQAAAEADIACLLVACEGDDRERWKETLAPIVPVARRAGIAVLAHGCRKAALAAGADGAHVEGAAAVVEQALARLKPDHIVGVGGLRSRHDAMVAGEMGADYVMFGQPARSRPDEVKEFVSWWATVFEVPCIGVASSLDEIAPLAEAGADFVALREAVWDAPQGPRAALAEAATRLAGTDQRILEESLS